MKRKLAPKATDALNVTPATVSDRTCAAILGLEPRVFRDLLVREGIQHAKIGRRVVARLEHVLAEIDRLATQATDATSAPVDDEQDEADNILAMLGRKRSA